ncbi:TetR/AcrR family transcriptional regulator [Pseudonocardia ailaonensis]|uniref:TetR/AcrR family transcriptional regulator n=1 Tax=Pseudonocardia ailaonensis TaxID=367279 RepID=A0ABN2NN33_9PSEU
MTTGQRADARRNYERILAVAKAEVAGQGSDASLERIARVAGVGSATVRRHFPSRYALLEAVSRAGVDALVEYADTLLDAGVPARDALLDWLREVVDHCITTRGLLAALSYVPQQGLVSDNSCFTSVRDAAAPLLARAQAEGAVADGTTTGDLLELVLGIVLATDGHPGRTVTAHRLFDITVAGISPSR